MPSLLAKTWKGEQIEGSISYSYKYKTPLMKNQAKVILEWASVVQQEGQGMVIPFVTPHKIIIIQHRMFRLKNSNRI